MSRSRQTREEKNGIRTTGVIHLRARFPPPKRLSTGPFPFSNIAEEAGWRGILLDGLEFHPSRFIEPERVKIIEPGRVKITAYIRAVRARRRCRSHRNSFNRRSGRAVSVTENSRANAAPPISKGLYRVTTFNCLAIKRRARGALNQLIHG